MVEGASLKDVGLEYLDALAEAQDAQQALETNDGDDYDPCGHTKKRVTAKFTVAIKRLAKATKALMELAV